MRRSVHFGLAFLIQCTLTGVPVSACSQALELPTQEEIDAARSAPLFVSHDILEMTLEADFHTIRRADRRDEDSEERPAVMRWTNPDGSTESQEIQVQTRGIFRLAKRNCEFPPLRLNVKKEPTKGTLFEGQDKLKLVVTCRPRRDEWEEYVVLEYLTYRTFNLLTDLSFRVRPARVTYVDTSGEDETFTSFAFIIEDDSQMATRNGGQKLEWETGQMDPRLMEDTHAILVDVFEYMIGNTDWSAVEMHNMELFRDAQGRPSTVPYDFDFSGTVDARYADPDVSLPIRTVTDRLFRGFCPDEMGRSQEQYDAVYDIFREKKEEIYQMWGEEEGLSEDGLKDSLEFFDKFYETINDPRRIQRYMMNSCRRLARR